MKELRRRGMTPTSLLEETKRSNYGLDGEINLKEEDRGFSNRSAVSTELEKSLSNQRERSMALNSEGLEVDKLFFSYQLLNSLNSEVSLALSCLSETWSYSLCRIFFQCCKLLSS
jgi:hypothetical protein